MATRAIAAALFVFGLLGVGGCGGGEGGDKSSRPAPLVERPTPKQPIAAEIGAFTRAIATHKCTDYFPLVHSFVRGRFRYARVSGIGPAQAGTPFSDRKAAARTAGRFVGSVRRRDCATMERLFSAKGSRLVISLGSPRAACRAVLRGKFLAPAVRETPHPRIEVLGGTRNLAFVGIATKRVYFTMMLGDTKKSGHRVIDVVPSTAVKLPKG